MVRITYVYNDMMLRFISACIFLLTYRYCLVGCLSMILDTCFGSLIFKCFVFFVFALVQLN